MHLSGSSVGLNTTFTLITPLLAGGAAFFDDWFIPAGPLRAGLLIRRTSRGVIEPADKAERCTYAFRPVNSRRLKSAFEFEENSSWTHEPQARSDCEYPFPGVGYVEDFLKILFISAAFIVDKLFGVIADHPDPEGFKDGVFQRVIHVVRTNTSLPRCVSV